MLTYINRSKPLTHKKKKKKKGKKKRQTLKPKPQFPIKIQSEYEKQRNRVNMKNRETWLENSGDGFIHSSAHLRDGDKERDSP